MKHFDGLLGSLIDLALAEDVGTGDVATASLVSTTVQGVAELVAKADGVVSGLAVAEMVFRRLDADCSLEALVADGVAVSRGAIIARIQGRYDALLTGERTALNFLQRMSGIATLTRRFVNELEGLPTRFLDTRKTAPGHRYIDKMAVRHGGGANHRMGLYDLAMIKDNHIAMAGGITAAVASVRATMPAYMRIEVETATLAQVDEAIAARADIIMLDNMSLDLMRQAVERIAGRAMTEASGNVSVATIRAIAETGVDFVSAGAVTHSSQALDISMRMHPVHCGCAAE